MFMHFWWICLVTIHDTFWASCCDLQAVCGRLHSAALKIHATRTRRQVDQLWKSKHVCRLLECRSSLWATVVPWSVAVPNHAAHSRGIPPTLQVSITNISSMSVYSPKLSYFGMYTCTLLIFVSACSHCSGARADSTKISTIISKEPGSISFGKSALVRSHTNAWARALSYSSLLRTTWTAVLE